MRQTVLLVMLLISSFSLKAQVDFKLKISKDAVMLNEPFIIEYEVNQIFSDFKLPDFKDFIIFSGPSTSSQQSINMVNGEMTKKILVKYTYYLKASKSGTLTIDPAEIKIGDDYYFSNSIDIIVLDIEYIDPNQKKGKDIKGTEKI